MQKKKLTMGIIRFKKIQEHRDLNFQGTIPGKVLFET